MTALLIIQNEDEREKVKSYFDGLEFDYTITNHRSSIHKVDGLRFTQVHFTPDVLIHGMCEPLFDALYTALISMSTDPRKGFRLLG